MLTALILICSASIAPNSDDCTRYNASTIIRVPTEFGSPATCFMLGTDAQMGAAELRKRVPQFL
jgi:hypothetical protein